MISSSKREQDEESLLRPCIQENAFCLQQSCSAQILLELINILLEIARVKNFRYYPSKAPQVCLLHIPYLSHKLDAFESMKLFHELE